MDSEYLAHVNCYLRRCRDLRARIGTDALIKILTREHLTLKLVPLLALHIDATGASSGKRHLRLFCANCGLFIVSSGHLVLHICTCYPTFSEEAMRDGNSTCMLCKDRIGQGTHKCTSLLWRALVLDVSGLLPNAIRLGVTLQYHDTAEGHELANRLRGGAAWGQSRSCSLPPPVRGRPASRSRRLRLRVAPRQWPCPLCWCWKARC